VALLARDLSRVWREQTADGLLEETLYHYLWLATNGPNIHGDRIKSLVAEAERRGKPEIIGRALAKVMRPKT